VDDNKAFQPVNDDDLDPGSFDLMAPAQSGPKQYSLETRSEQLFSVKHLRSFSKTLRFSYDSRVS
jgi:hypothetical protein